MVNINNRSVWEGNFFFRLRLVRHLQILIGASLFGTFKEFKINVKYKGYVKTIRKINFFQ